MFVGQYKSTLVCNVCEKVSVTFDAFLTVSLPIPGKKENIKIYFIEYDINGNSNNYQGSISVRDSENISIFREEINKKYSVGFSDYIITSTHCNDIKKMYRTNDFISSLTSIDGVVICYQIPKNLSPSIPNSASKTDSNNGISEEWTKLVVN